MFSLSKQKSTHFDYPMFTGYDRSRTSYTVLYVPIF